MALTKNDLRLISQVLDEKLDQKLGELEKRLEKRFDKKLLELEKRLDQKLKAQRIEIVDTILNHLRENYVTKTEFNELKEQVSHLPTKQEFYKRMDQLSGEYLTFQQESTILRTRTNH